MGSEHYNLNFSFKINRDWLISVVEYFIIQVKIDGFDPDKFRKVRP